MTGRLRTIFAATIVLAAVALSLLALPATVDAQASVTGAADFRSAPQLPPGTYTDRIVTGDSAWYAITYTNNTPYRFEVDFVGEGPGQGVDLTVALVAPTLTVVDGPSRIVEGSGAEYPLGHTNTWFLRVSLATTSQVGIEFPVSISVEGVAPEGTEPCAEVPGCTLDEEYAAVNVAIAEVEAEIEARGARESRAAVEAEIENAKSFAETSAQLRPGIDSRLAAAEARMAELCAPDPLCDEFPDQGSRTPLLGWVIGLAALAFGIRRAIKRLTSDPSDDESAAPRAPRSKTALERANDQAKAKADKK